MATPPLYPVGLILAGRPCLVVGAGPVGRRKLDQLLACGAVVTVIDPAIDPDALPTDVTLWRRPYGTGDVAGFRVVIACTNDPATNASVYREASGAGIAVNVADDPEHCTFTLPSVVRRGPVTVAVATDGHSPALAKELRDRIATMLDALDVEGAAASLAAERTAMQHAGASTESIDWTQRVRQALDR